MAVVDALVVIYFQLAFFFKFSKNGLHGLPGLCGLPAIHTISQIEIERGGHKTSAMLGCYCSCGCSGCDLFSASFFLNLPRMVSIVCLVYVVYLQLTQYGRGRGEGKTSAV